MSNEEDGQEARPHHHAVLPSPAMDESGGGDTLPVIPSPAFLDNSLCSPLIAQSMEDEFPPTAANMVLPSPALSNPSNMPPTLESPVVGGPIPSPAIRISDKPVRPTYSPTTSVSVTTADAFAGLQTVPSQDGSEKGSTSVKQVLASPVVLLPSPSPIKATTIIDSPNKKSVAEATMTIPSHSREGSNVRSASVLKREVIESPVISVPGTTSAIGSSASADAFAGLLTRPSPSKQETPDIRESDAFAGLTTYPSPCSEPKRESTEATIHQFKTETPDADAFAGLLTRPSPSKQETPDIRESDAFAGLTTYPSPCSESKRESTEAIIYQFKTETPDTHDSDAFAGLVTHPSPCKQETPSDVSDDHRIIQKLPSPAGSGASLKESIFHQLFSKRLRSSNSMEKGIVKRTKLPLGAPNKKSPVSSTSRIIPTDNERWQPTAVTHILSKPSDEKELPPFQSLFDIFKERYGHQHEHTHLSFKGALLRNPKLLSELKEIQKQNNEIREYQKKALLESEQVKEFFVEQPKSDCRIFHISPGEGSCDVMLWDIQSANENRIIDGTLRDYCLPNNFIPHLRDQLNDLVNEVSKPKMLPPSLIGQVITNGSLHTARVFLPSTASNELYQSLALYCMSAARVKGLPLGCSRDMFNNFLTRMQSLANNNIEQRVPNPIVAPKKRVDQSQWGMTTDVVADSETAARLLVQARWKLCPVKPSKKVKLFTKGANREATDIIRCRRTTVFGTKKRIQTVKKYRTITATMNHLCVKCGEFLQLTPTMRRGPRGKDTLCNGCGIAFHRGQLF